MRSRPSGALHITSRLDDPPVANAHQIDAAHGACAIRSPYQPPSDLAAIAARDDAFRLEMRPRHGGDLGPERDAGGLALMAGAVRRRLRVLDDAVVGDQYLERRRIVGENTLVEALQDRFGLHALGVVETAAGHRHFPRRCLYIFVLIRTYLGICEAVRKSS